MRRASHATAALCAVMVAAAVALVSVDVRPVSAADVNPYVKPLRTAAGRVDGAAAQIAVLGSRASVTPAVCARAANRLAVAADAAAKALASYQNARQRYGTQEEFGLLRSMVTRLYEAHGSVNKLVGDPTRPPTAAEQSAARREVSLFRQVVAAKIAERFQVEGLQDALTARSLRELKAVVVNELHGQVRSRIEDELRRITGLGISLGVPLKVQIRQQAELALSRLLSRLVFKAGPAGILIELVAGRFIDPGRIVQVVGAKLREALRPKGNLAARTRQSIATLERSRRSLNAIPRDAATARARRAIRDAERTLKATRFLEGDLRKAGDLKKLTEISVAKNRLSRTMRLTGFRFLLDAELLEYDFRDAIAFAQRVRREALAAAKKCGEQTQQPPPPVAQADFTGIYSTSYGTMVLRQSGSSVTGCYTHDDGKLTGTVSGNVLSGTWKEAPHQTDTDRGGLVYTKTGGGFTGRWNYDKNGGLAKLKESQTGGGNWNGTLVQRDAPCTP